MRIAVVTPIPTPYRDPFWSEVNRRDDVELEVNYCAAGKGDRPWKGDWEAEFRAEVLPGRNLLKWRGADASCYWNPSIKQRLKAGNCDAIIVGGYNHPTLLAAMRYAARNGVPYYLMSESHLLNPRRAGRRFLKRKLVERVIRHAAGLFPTGKLAAEYLLHYGADAERICFLPNVPDVERLSETAERLRERGTDAIRQRYGLSGRPTVLFVGRLIPKKGVDVLIRAFRKVREELDAELVIAGDGATRGELERQAAEAGLKERVRFSGFVQPEAVTELYAASDVFVLPSSETWGVAAIEAAACGLPVILSDRVGCHPDVVTDSRIGEVFTWRDAEGLAAVLCGRLRDPSQRLRAEEAVNLIRSKFSYPVVAEQMVQSVRGERRVAPVKQAPMLTGAAR